VRTTFVSALLVLSTCYRTLARRHLGIGLILLTSAAALTYQAQHVGLTTDEPSHFAAAYMYWLGEDVLVPADTPPLTRTISGWVPRILGAQNPHGSKYWERRDAYLIGAEILATPNSRARRLLFYTRLPFLIFPLLIVFLTWHWSRQLFGEPIALTLAACSALEPTILGHGAIINSDVPAAFAALWFSYTTWKYWREPNVLRMLIMTLALTVAVLTKFTLLPLVLVGYGLALWRGPRPLAAITIPIILYTGILAASQFDAQPIPQAEIDTFSQTGAPGWALPGLEVLARLPWPTQFVRALLYIGKNMQGDGWTGYMLGHKVNGRTPAYFPLAWALKFPIPLQMLTIAGLVALFDRIRRRQVSATDSLIWFPPLLFFGTAIFSNYHIGFRHVLPALPFLILDGGFAIQRWHHNYACRTAIALGLAWLAVSSIAVYPHGISYFNAWIGSPINAWKYFADSNIDWGQNWPEVAEYVKRNQVRTINTFIFSFDSPWHYIKEGLAPQPWPDLSIPVGYRYQPRPGTYFVSVNLLSGLLFPQGHENYLEFFQQRAPDGRAGHSILIYNVP
jgi:Dolichyl-phosphate-mannose-protein mannosyltransferase